MTVILVTYWLHYSISYTVNLHTQVHSHRSHPVGDLVLSMVTFSIGCILRRTRWHTLLYAITFDPKLDRRRLKSIDDAPPSFVDKRRQYAKMMTSSSKSTPNLRARHAFQCAFVSIGSAILSYSIFVQYTTETSMSALQRRRRHGADTVHQQSWRQIGCQDGQLLEIPESFLV